jgi:hypothetical protein
MNNFFLNKHYEFLKHGLPNKNGLCEELGKLGVHFGTTNTPRYAVNIFELFEPDDIEKDSLVLDDNTSDEYWGDEIKDGGINAYKRSGEYTTLRQTIVLLCHEILNSQ